jgi:hypothetical protein
MAGLVRRPDAIIAHRPGLLQKDQFQVAYTTTDLDRACELFRRQYGIGDYDYIGGDLPGGGTVRVALAWAGETNYEIIEAHGPAGAFYTHRLPAEGFAIQFHHLGFLIHDREAWRALEQEFVERGTPIVFQTLGSGFMDAFYIEAPGLGHYLEYIYPEPAGVEFLAKMPGNWLRDQSDN